MKPVHVDSIFWACHSLYACHSSHAGPVYVLIRDLRYTLLRIGLHVLFACDRVSRRLSGITEWDSADYLNVFGTGGQRDFVSLAFNSAPLHPTRDVHT